LSKSKLLAVNLLLAFTLIGCAHQREWKLPTQGTVSKSPAELVDCIQNVFEKQQREHTWKLLQRTSKTASGEIFWDQMDSTNVILHRVVISPANDVGGSNYRVDAGFLGMAGLGFIEICFQ
jgi:hypothetical protein